MVDGTFPQDKLSGHLPTDASSNSVVQPEAAGASYAAWKQFSNKAGDGHAEQGQSGRESKPADAARWSEISTAERDVDKATNRLAAALCHENSRAFAYVVHGMGNLLKASSDAIKTQLCEKTGIDVNNWQLQWDAGQEGKLIGLNLRKDKDHSLSFSTTDLKDGLPSFAIVDGDSLFNEFAERTKAHLAGRNRPMV